jgi:hypothetical protein
MKSIVIELADHEDIVRVFFRYPGQVKSFRTLLARDFARKITKENGISLLRVGVDFLTRREALNYVPTKQLKGLAICKSSDLKKLGLTFMANSEKDGHFTARCRGCDMNPFPRPVICSPIPGQACALDLEAATSLAQTLADLFVIDTEVS